MVPESAQGICRCPVIGMSGDSAPRNAGCKAMTAIDRQESLRDSQ